jgi:hypothetical protein
MSQEDHEMHAGLLTDERQVFPVLPPSWDLIVALKVRFVLSSSQYSPRISEPSGSCHTDAGTFLAFFSLRSLQTGLGAVNLSEPKRGFR